LRLLHLYLSRKNGRLASGRRLDKPQRPDFTLWRRSKFISRAVKFSEYTGIEGH
jgi:hypothetical protein